MQKQVQLRRILNVLGPFTYSESDQRVALRPSGRRLLALLAIKDAISRIDAAGVLWPDLSQGRALGNLRTVLWRIRNDAAAATVQDDDILRLGDEVRVDLHDVRAWAGRALRNEEPWMPVPSGAFRELLPGWGEPWLLEIREEVRLLELYALEAAAQRLMLGGRVGEAANLARAAVGVDPIRESANRLLIEIYLRDGNRCDALRQFRRFETVLRDELDAEPGPGVTALLGSFMSMPAMNTRRAAPPGRFSSAPGVVHR